MNIFVGCGALEPQKEVFRDTALKLGNFIVENNHNFVFGGSNKGMMGIIYSIVADSKGDSRIFVSTCDAYKHELTEISYNAVSNYDTVEERTYGYFVFSDVLVFIPGGFGTITELMMSIEAARANEHGMFIVIANIDVFFDPLLEMFQKIYDDGFGKETIKDIYTVTSSIEETLDVLNRIDSLINLTKSV